MGNPVIPSIASAAVSGVGNILGTFLGNSAQSAEAERNREFQHREAELAYQRQVEQWQREAEYNNPRNQMSRFAAAGLNPNLIYGQMQNTPSASSAPQAGSVSTPKLDSLRLGVPIQQAFDNFLQLKQFNLNEQMQNQNIEVAKAQAEKIRAETAGINEENSFKLAIRHIRELSAQGDLDTKTAQRLLFNMTKSYYEQKVRELDNQNTFFEATKEKRLDAFDSELALTKARVRAINAAANVSNAEEKQKVYDLEFQKSISQWIKDTYEFTSKLKKGQLIFQRETLPFLVRSANQKAILETLAGQFDSGEMFPALGKFAPAVSTFLPNLFRPGTKYKESPFGSMVNSVGKFF